MEQNLTFQQNIDTLFANLEDFTKKESILGQPVSYADKTFIPVVSVTLGYGSGTTASKGQQGTSGAGTTTGMGTAAGMGNGTGLGLGAKINTDAVIVIDKDNVSMLQINQNAGTSQIMDKIPQILMNMSQSKQQGQQGQQSQQQ